MSDKPSSRPSRKVGKSTKSNPAETAAPKKRKAKAPKKEIKKLEYEIVGKLASITIAGKTLKFKTWGLAKRLQLGARISLLMDQLRPFIPEEGEASPQLLISVLGQLADDIIYIAVESTIETFLTHSEGVEWIDENCGPEDLFALGKIVYDMNLKDAESMGKLEKGMSSLADQLTSLLKT